MAKTATPIVNHLRVFWVIIMWLCSLLIRLGRGIPFALPLTTLSAGASPTLNYLQRGLVQGTGAGPCGEVA
jgi:hypothetical protein